jgi:hypothetical protein
MHLALQLRGTLNCIFEQREDDDWSLRVATIVCKI